MKDEGMWPQSAYSNRACLTRPNPESDKSGELEKLLDKADDDTLAQVYQAILSDMKLLPNRKSD